MGQGAAENEMVVKQDLKVVAEVRRFVRLVTGQWGMDDFVPCLVASELVTNALQHAESATSATGDDVILRLSRTEDDALWMEVQDAAYGLPHMLAADTTSETGRGLFIVDQYARCWGIRALADNVGKVVFAVLDRT
ncbi:ATP-binding protein [Actinomadura latina]|uniref:ATP-binding protein n=1 Tax=Actinomadura latina TaxID=163603 RepID=A0A846YYK6_9ACTN|nr:ATP-binding protein [Actinomadura latina]NKZ05609.1 ATP-binding protein [Actinomadura latina]